MASSLTDAAKAKMAAQTPLRAKVKARGPVEPGTKITETGPVQLNHPTLDTPEAGYRTVYNPPAPADRFQFLKTFATIPALRSKGVPQS